MVPRSWLALAVLGTAVGTLPEAHADEPITSTNYTIEFYDGVAIGNTQLVGMGGAGSALITGTSGALLNPSAMAVRPTTDTLDWNWDWHADFLTAGGSKDYDNNGQDSAGGASLITAGLGFRIQDWSFAGTFIGQAAPIEGSAPALDVEAIRLRGMLAKYFPSFDTAIGIGIQSGSLQVDNNADDQDALFLVTGVGPIIGATWLPKYRDVRVAAAFEGRVVGKDISATCDPMNCQGFILPDRVTTPWRLILGGAWRFSPTQWNQLVGGTFRDERSLTLATDIVVVGASREAYGIEAFGMHLLQRTGRNTSVSVRGGADYEAFPGRLRLRAGSYWEPERYDDVPGRLHVTFGAELRVFEFFAWGLRRRGRISFTADVAERYRNVALSVGFWH